ncbi:MAG: hypothetical protein QGH25_05525 [Candidatus Latescibacteria bacterium]|jgi:acetyl-CoA hydrolase|nr:hypothetical protein [Candidatus Latescibacterota bacterium]
MRQCEITLRVLSEPTTVNFHGGAVAKWIDEIGYTCAPGGSGPGGATVCVSGIRLHRPIHLGAAVGGQLAPQNRYAPVGR